MKKKTILLAVTGLSPQVITETLYALHQLNKPMPDRIILLTTQIGANEAQKHLIDGGKIAQFCEDYNIKPIVLKSSDICIIPDDDGVIFDKQYADKQMNTLADFICQKVQKLTQDDSTIIHASLAGGRKTMTYFLGTAMSWYGREHDCLSHVVVSEGYESSDFFYPTPYSYNITNYRGSLLDAKKATVWLTDIPIARLRAELPVSMLDGKTSYSQTVQWLNFRPSELSIRLDITVRKLYCGQLNCTLPVREFAFYLWFCHRARKHKSGLFIPDINKPEASYAAEFLACYAQIVDEFKYEKMLLYFRDKNGMSKSYFEELKSRTNRTIIRSFGKKIAQRLIVDKSEKDYHVVHDKKRKLKKEKYRFAILLESTKIKFMEDDNDILT